jgi:hypothetical protein
MVNGEEYVHKMKGMLIFIVILIYCDKIYETWVLELYPVIYYIECE